MERSYFKHKTRTKRFVIIAGWIVVGILAATGFAFLLGYIIMVLWNWLMPDIFGLVEIGYWQAVGLIIFAKIIFGGFGPHKKHPKSSNEGRFTKKTSYNKLKSGFSKWKYYDKFWNEEGEKSFKEYSKKQDFGDDEKDNIK